MTWMNWFPNAAVVAACLTAVAAFLTILYERRNESKSVNNAVQAEIQRLLGVLSSHEKWWAERIKLKNTDQPLIPFSHVVYTGQVKRIGILDHKTVNDVVRFYGNVDFINALQGQHDQYVAKGHLEEFDWRYHEALLNCFEYFAGRFDLDEKQRTDYFTASYRFTLCSMKRAFFIHDALGSTDIEHAVFLRAKKVIDFVRKPEERYKVPVGFVDQLGPPFTQFENAVQTKDIVNVEAAWNLLYLDAAIDLPLRLLGDHISREDPERGSLS
jgi:hypothetical protein